MYFGLGRGGSPKLIVRWVRQPTLETYVQIIEDEAVITQKIIDEGADVCIFDYSRTPCIFKREKCALSLWHAGIDGAQASRVYF